MAEAQEPQEAAPKKASKWPVLIGGVLALLLGAGGFYATFSGMIGVPGTQSEAEHAAEPLPEIAFVPVDTVVMSLGAAGNNQHLKFSSQLEVTPQYAAEVARLMPRILDIINSYLRAVEVTHLQRPDALLKIRAQLLRRIQVVTGEGRVRDLLVTEFVLN